MAPYLKVGNFLIAMYPLCVATGFLLATIIGDRTSHTFGISEKQSFSLICISEIGVIIGAKIMYLIIHWKLLALYYERFGFALVLHTGFVLYGGLIGAIVGVFIFSRIKQLCFIKTLAFVLTLAPLVQAIGRLGCLCAGCCYGIPSSAPFAIHLHGASRFPVQILSAILDLSLFVILQVARILKASYKSLVSIYFIGYGAIRLLCEHFRGDSERGFFLSLSIATYCSMLSILIGIVISLPRKHRTPA